jgi:hypothetical protein
MRLKNQTPLGLDSERGSKGVVEIASDSTDYTASRIPTQVARLAVVHLQAEAAARGERGHLLLTLAAEIERRAAA